MHQASLWRGIWCSLASTRRGGPGRLFLHACEGVQAAVLLRELPEGHIRVSLRSRGELNVAASAERMGGGGHRNAGGCTLDGALARACDAILAELRHLLVAGSERSSNIP